MNPYTVREGDSLSRISSIHYGSADFAERIRTANPQASGGLTPGMVLTIPDVNEVPALSTPRGIAGGLNEVAVTVAGKRFRFWSTMQLSRAVDSVSTFSLTAPFEPDNAAFRDVFLPLQFQSVAISIGGAPVFEGVIVPVSPAVTAADRTITVGGYSRAGVLQDCVVPAASSLFEFDEMNLQNITRSVIEPFGLSVTFDTPAGATVKRIGIGAQTRVWAFLVSVAHQKNMIIGDDAAGMPVFRQSAAGTPVADLEVGRSPLRSVSANLKPQRYFSSVTAQAESDFGLDGAHHTIENPHLRGVLRPLTFSAGDTEPGALEIAARAKIGRMFANAIGYTVDVAGWRDPAGNLWEPGASVRLFAPDAMVYANTEFQIRRATATRDAAEDTTTLDLVLPGAFSGEIPERLPWD